MHFGGRLVGFAPLPSASAKLANLGIVFSMRPSLVGRRSWARAAVEYGQIYDAAVRAG
jgi:hypothetical protein